MATFKEDMYDDVGKTFLELNEFAETHTFDGKEMPLVIDEFEAERRQIRTNNGNNVDGVFKKQILVFAPRDQFEKQPTAGTRVIKLDGKRYNVVECAEEGDMYAITLEVYSGK